MANNLKTIKNALEAKSREIFTRGNITEIKVDRYLRCQHCFKNVNKDLFCASCSLRSSKEEYSAIAHVSQFVSTQINFVKVIISLFIKNDDYFQ